MWLTLASVGCGSTKSTAQADEQFAGDMVQQMTGIILMVASLVMFGFYSFHLCWPWLACLWVVGIVVILVVFFVSFLQVLDSKPRRKGTGRSRADWYEA